jgi:hypothetical protein
MTKNSAIAGCALLILLLLGGIVFFRLHDRTIEGDATQANAAPPEQLKAGPEKQPTIRGPIPRTSERAERDEREPRVYADAGAPAQEEHPPRAAHDYHDIEEIKRQIYERNIEYLEQIHLLDELVQTGDTDTRRFWGDRWSGVDDWKRSSNGFSLERTADGGLLFLPDEETARTYTFFENIELYTYDPHNGEFVSEIDYYGKTIYNVLRFINDDVLVMMTISGRKVDLNIYQRDHP